MKETFQNQFLWNAQYRSARVSLYCSIDWLIDPNRSQMPVDSLIEQVENLDFVRFLWSKSTKSRSICYAVGGGGGESTMADPRDAKNKEGKVWICHWRRMVSLGIFPARVKESIKENA